MKKKHIIAVLAVIFLIMSIGTVAWVSDPPLPPLPPAYAPCAGNLIVNGDFSAGNTGFSSGYTFIGEDPTRQNELYAPKTYSIGTNPNLFHNAWGVFGDHTTGNGNMMIVNATCLTGGGAGCEPNPLTTPVWEQTVNVEAGRTYIFSYYIALSYGTAPPLLQVSVNDVPIGTYDANTNPIAPVGEWRLVSYTWDSGLATSAKITIVDQRPVYDGDDYCLDDLTLCPQTPAQVCLPTVWNLTAGQTIDVGSVTVTNDQANIYVTYELDTSTQPDAVFGELHMWLGTDLSLMPATNKGFPIPGQFCSAQGGACSFGAADGKTSYTFTIPWSQVAMPTGSLACNDKVYVVTHAEVKNVNSGGSLKDETAFGGDTPGSGPRWWFYGLYTICCEDEWPPVEACYRETAFAKGGWVFTTDKKSNPEKLPSLNLTRNRWGWAINLTAPGNYFYDIWAGAGLNKTANGVKVGTLAVAWDGTNVNVTYNMFSGYFLEEVHLYAGDLKPTTLAPGQYGNLAEFDPVASTYAFPAIPLADTNGDGVWLIGHAVVSNGNCQPVGAPAAAGSGTFTTPTADPVFGVLPLK